MARLLFATVGYLLFGKPWCLSTLWWCTKRRQQLQNPDSAILRLPVEIIGMISKKLPLESQIVFSMTCRSLRTTLSNSHNAVTRLPRPQYLEFLAAIARDMPDKWVCGDCAKLHAVDLRDTPEFPISFPLRTSCLCSPRQRMSGIFESHLPFIEGIILHHRHVQLSLKYTRLGNNLHQMYRKYLENLLKELYGSFIHHPSEPNSLYARYCVIPKIIRGRYLLRCVYTYMSRQAAVSRRTLGLLRVCEHQAFWSYLEPLRNNIFSPQRCCILERVITEAFKHPDITILGSCDKCPVDFSLKANSQRAFLHVWYDMGSEGSPLEPDWRIHVPPQQRGRQRQRDPDNPNEFTVYHKPGSIQKLYENDIRYSEYNFN